MTDRRDISDAELMAAISGGDETALRTLIRKFRPLVFRTAQRITCRVQDAEDITQEVFIRVWQQADRFNGKSSLTTWLYRIAANLSVDRLRRQKTILSRIRELVPGRTGERQDISAEDRMIASEEWEIFCKASERLSPKQRLVFTLKEIEGLDTEEVTFITGLDADQIKSNLYLARKAIKTLMEEYGYGK